MKINPIILHPAFTQAREALARALVTDMPGQLIFVVGLSGAGKSEIRYAAMQAFAGSPELWAPGKLPVIALRAAATDRSSFSSKEFMTRFYLELLEPNLGWLAERSGIQDPDLGHLLSEARLTSPFWKELRHKSPEHQLRGYGSRRDRATARLGRDNQAGKLPLPDLGPGRDQRGACAGRRSRPDPWPHCDCGWARAVRGRHSQHFHPAKRRSEDRSSRCSTGMAGRADWRRSMDK